MYRIPNGVGELVAFKSASQILPSIFLSDHQRFGSDTSKSSKASTSHSGSSTCGPTVEKSRGIRESEASRDSKLRSRLLHSF